MPFELSWRPGGSVGFLSDLFRIFELTIMVVRGREGCFVIDLIFLDINCAQVTYCIEPNLR